MGLSFLLGCGTSDGGPLGDASDGGAVDAASEGAPLVVGEGDVLVKGSVTREMTVHTNNDPITPVEGAHVHFELRRYQGEDATAPLVVEGDAPYRELPFRFELRGDARTAFPAGASLLLSVNVANHSGTESRVGDLVSEYSNEVRSVGAELAITVSGLESCNTPLGGFCSSLE